MNPAGGDTTVPVDDNGASAAAELAVPGGKIGRFVVVGALGSGGMGVVLSGYDPALDRKVAIKLLRPDAYVHGGRARLQREAQAMARVSHPNVATVYEVGTAGEQLFVAMELVSGQTLKGWLGERRRSRREIVQMFAQAGRGLEAAHAASLVHRDFKPDNVLVGSDQRPRVTDFGLVSAPPEATLPPGAAVTTTISGAGTPAYMSPEQVARGPVDARSDQFSFCVALYEALYRERPFAPDAPPRDRHAPASRGGEVPGWLAQVVARGLSQRPEDRWPSMTELLVALGRDPAIARQRWVMGASLVGLAALAAFGIKLSRDQQDRRCTDGEARLTGVWDAPQKQRLEAAFGKLGRGVELWPRVRNLVDGYAHSWASMHDEACRATRIDGRQSEALLDLRMACLDRRRATLGALANVWAASLDEKGVERAPGVAGSLPPLDECNDVRALTEPLPLPRDPAAQKQIAGVRAQLDTVKALLATSDWRGARKAAVEPEKAADATGYPPVQAEAKLLLATALDRLDDAAAVPLLQEAARLGALAHDDRLASRALILLVKVLSSDAVKFAEAQALVPAAAAFIARAGDPAELRGALMVENAHALLDGGKPREAERLALEAKALLEQALPPRSTPIMQAASIAAGAADDVGDYQTARLTYQQLVDDAREIYGPDSPREGSMLKNLGMVEQHSGQYAKARAHYQRALEIIEKRLGPDNQETADATACLGSADSLTGQLDEAAALFQKSIDIIARSHGADAYLAVVKSNLGGVRRDQGRLDEASRLGQEALALAAKSYGETHPQYAALENEYGHTLARRGDHAGAHARFVHAAAVYRTATGPDSPTALNAEEDLVELEARHGGCADARPKLEKLALAQEAKIGATAPLAITLLALAYCDQEEKRPADALEHSQRAEEILRQDGAPAALGEARLDLAQALWATGDRARALDKARQARNDLLRAAEAGRPALAKLEAWLAAR